MQNFSSHKQSGVTLLLALLLLSAITAISFSLATIVFIEARASSDLARTEPALYGTLAVLEDASFDIKRGAGNLAGLPDTQLNCIRPGQCVDIISNVSSFRDTTVLEKIISVPPNDYGDTKNVYFLINPDNLYADDDNSGSPDGGYGKIIVTNISDVPVRVSLCKLTTEDCLPVPLGAGKAWEFDGVLPGPNASQTQNDSTMPGSSYQLYVRNQDNNGSGTADGYVKIQTFGPDGSTPKGLPYFGQKVLDVSATYSGITRRYRALIPEQ